MEVTPCIVPVMPGLALCVGGIGAAPDYGEVVSKSFLLAHKLDRCWSVYAPFICVIGI